jgi:hypothetical protein
MLNFVENWLFIYGEPQRREGQTSMKQRFEEQVREFKDVVNDFLHPYSETEHDAAPPLPNASKARTDCALTQNIRNSGCDCNCCISLQQKHKIFQILRIRNRFDPALLDVPGGYRDFAIKIKIGFFRCA